MIAGEIQVFGAKGGPAESQPTHRVDDGINVLLFFFSGVRVIQTQVTNATKILRQTEIQADRFGVTNMQIAIGFWWESSTDSCRIGFGLRLIRAGTGVAPPAAPGPVARRQIRFNSVADEI